MSEIRIEVVEDTGRSQGGHAIIRVNGLWLLPANATLRIEPVDELDAELLPAGWPKGDLTPVETRLTPQGVEIVVGPDVVDCPSLLPGTPVSVSVPSAFVKAEVLWPDLPVSIAAEASPAVLTAAELAAELDAAARSTHQHEEAEALLQLKRRMNGAGNDPIVFGHDHKQLDARTDLAQLRYRDDAGDDGVQMAAAQFLPLATMYDTPVTHDRLKRDMSVSSPLTGTALAADPNRPRAVVPVAAKPNASQRRQLSMGVPFGLGFLVAGALTGLVALRQGGSGGVPPVTGEPISGAASLSDVLAVAVVSPRGRQATEVDLAAALKLADENLHGTSGPADPQEASFWLRKSISMSVGTPQLAWALTKLGTLYAQPTSGPPDYGKARLLWEMAGDSGDATALCFLGALHEFGLGVASSKAKALAIYQRGKAAGGCRDIDTAINRVRP